MLAATIQAPDLLGYFYGRLALIDPTGGMIKEALNQIADRTWEMIETMMQTAYDSLGLQCGGPQERLAFYDTKPPAAWGEQRAKYPKDYAEDLADYERLKLRRTEGDL